MSEGAEGAPLLSTYPPSEGGLDRANYYGSINVALNIAAVHMQAANYEAVVQLCGRSRCILPTWGCVRGGWVLPVDSLLRVRQTLARPCFPFLCLSVCACRSKDINGIGAL
jgi:hypothetical protein